jgi:hypothetical protein
MVEGVVVLYGEGDFGVRPPKSSPPPALPHCHGRALTGGARETCQAC